MTVLVIALGTHGDVAPYTGLGKRIQQAGHHVAVATQAPFAELVTGCGLEFRELPGDPQAIMSSPEGRRTQRPGPLAMVRILGLIKAAVREMGEGVLDVTRQGADVVLLSMAAEPLGRPVAGGLGVPTVSTSLVPAHPTGDFPAPGLSALVPSLGRWGNRAISRLSAKGTNRIFRATVDDLRRRLGAAPGTIGTHPLLHGFSPTVVPRPADWPDGVEVAGYWWPERPSGWAPPADLVQFLAAGPPPVFLSFGSAVPGDPTTLATLALGALREAGVRGVIQAGWAGLDAVSDDVITVGSVPHDWLFPQMAAVVHHCGAGTTAAGLRAGVPAVGVPVNLDQPFWASRLVHLGVSPGPIRARSLTTAGLARAIEVAVTDPTYRQRARAVAERIADEDGTRLVIDAIGETLTASLTAGHSTSGRDQSSGSSSHSTLSTWTARWR